VKFTRAPSTSCASSVNSQPPVKVLVPNLRTCEKCRAAQAPKKSVVPLKKENPDRQIIAVALDIAG